MCARKTVNCDDFRVIFKSETFPTSSFGLAHDLEPGLAAKIKKAFEEYRFTPEMQKQFAGADRFFPITYKKDWGLIREIAEASGETYSRDQFEKESAKEAEAARKKKEAAGQKKQ